MYFPQKFSFGDDFLAGIRDSAVMVARNRMCICSSLQTRKLFVLEIFFVLLLGYHLENTALYLS